VFPPTWGAFISAVLTRRIRLAEIERELTAQIERLASAGILLTHLDAHKHVYAFPPVFAMVVRLASRFGVAAIRVPHERPSARVLWRYRATPGARRQAFENLVLGPWASTGRRLLARHGLSAAPRFHGRALTGLWTRERFRDFLGRLPQGRHELMMHPGYVDPALDALPTRLREQRAEEVDVLTDPVALELIERRGIVLARHDRPSVHRVVCHSHAS